MPKSNFIIYLIKNRIENFIFVMGFIFAMIGYSFWKPLGIMLNLSEEQSYSVFYICISVSFFFYTFAYYLTKYHKWRWFPMFVYLVCLSRVILEITSPEDESTKEYVQAYDLAEYALFILTIFIVFVYYVQFRYRKFLKYKNESNSNNNSN